MRFCPNCAAPLPHRPPLRCPACGAEHWRNAKPCAGALVTDGDGRLLLLRRNTGPWLGWWDIPGGFCDAEEHPMAAAVRETGEETGLAVEITGYLGMWLDRYPGPDDPDHVVTLNAYYHAVVGGSVGTPDPHETSALAWFGPDELPEIAFDHARLVLAAWRDAVRDGRTVTPLPDRVSEAGPGGG
jgi:ADP-ribose pyrophosphatase YjhB (NUDIX family)